jgi:hypothetical protein
MKSVLRLTIEYLKDNFDLRLYLQVLALLSVLISFNYWLDFEDQYIDQYRGTIWQGVFFLLFQGLPFLLTAWLCSRASYCGSWWKDQDFWITFILLFGINALDRSVNLGSLLRDTFLPAIDPHFRKTLNWGLSILTVMLPLWFFYKLKDKKHQRHFYGLTFKNPANLRSYVQLLLLVVCLVVIGSFLGDLQNYYPRFKLSQAQVFAENNGWNHWQSILMFEIAYGISFINVELFYRGALILAFYRFLGPSSVLPMIVAYCMLHFGKPLSEAISSIFGGFILGVLVIKNKNIWEGIILHLGVAWTMDLMGYLHKYVWP